MEIISAHYVLPIDQEPIIGGAMVVDHGEIIDIGPEKEIIKRYENADHLNFPDHVLMPGLVNSHCHLEMGAHINYAIDPVRNMGIKTSFIDWLLATIQYKSEANVESMRQAVEEGIEESINSGTTTIGEMGGFEGIFQCLEQSGMRGVIFPELFSFDSQVAFELYETALAIVDKYLEEDSELINVGVGPYSPYTLSRNILRVMSSFGLSDEIPIMIHVAESFSEVEFFYDSSGDIATHLFPNIGWGESLPPAFQKTPIEYLDAIGFLRSKPSLVGCVQATPKELKLIEYNQAKIVWCPRFINYLSLGDFPLKRILEHDINVSLGTDGLSSNNSLSMWDEMRFAANQFKEFNLEPDYELILKMATLNGAKSVQLDEEIGSLTPGKKSDYLLVKIGSMKEGESIYEHLVKHTKSYHVKKVVVGENTIKNQSS